jgi:hypothetical protein
MMIVLIITWAIRCEPVGSFDRRPEHMQRGVIQPTMGTNVRVDGGVCSHENSYPFP